MTSIHGNSYAPFKPISQSPHLQNQPLNKDIQEPKEAHKAERLNKKASSNIKEEDLHYGNKLSPEALKHIAELKAIDMEVRAHEQAHQAVGGKFAGGIAYKFQKGPDGQQYAVAGEVPIQMPKGETPEETIQIMEQVQRAALAPAQPSSQDLQVAAKASQMMMQAQAELSSARHSEGEKEEDQPSNKVFEHAVNQYKQQNDYIEKPTNIFDISA